MAGCFGVEVLWNGGVWVLLNGGIGVVWNGGICLLWNGGIWVLWNGVVGMLRNSTIGMSLKAGIWISLKVGIGTIYIVLSFILFSYRFLLLILFFFGNTGIPDLKPKHTGFLLINYLNYPLFQRLFIVMLIL